MKRRSDASMHSRRVPAWALAACLASSAAACAHAQTPSACDRPELQGQQRDPATIRRLEKAWATAFLHGDTGLEACLLLPDFIEISSDGRVRHLDDELALARANQGKHLSMPDFPVPHVLLHGDAAVAFDFSTSKTADGQLRQRWLADYYVWDHGAWRVYFAQQTLVKPR